MDKQKKTGAQVIPFPQPQRPPVKAVQTISGHGNVGVVGDNNQVTQNINTTTTTLKVEPPPNTIGAHAALRRRITDLIREIEEQRRARLGAQFKYGSVQGIAAEALGLKKSQWQQVWLWDASRAPEVIEVLERARDNTTQGRINKAARRQDYGHTRGHLFRLEKDYLAQLGWGDEKAREERLLMTGETSRAHMSDAQFGNWVAHLNVTVRRMYGEI